MPEAGQQLLLVLLDSDRFGAAALGTVMGMQVVSQSRSWSAVVFRWAGKRWLRKVSCVNLWHSKISSGGLLPSVLSCCRSDAGVLVSGRDAEPWWSLSRGKPRLGFDIAGFYLWRLVLDLSKE